MNGVNEMNNYKNMELEEIIAGAEDITEPACMEKISMYMEQLQVDDDAFMELLLDKLKFMIITWEQPWYQKSNCLTRPLHGEEDAYTEKYRTDTISQVETEKIQKNWNKLRKKFDLPDKLICLARWRNKDKSRNPRAPQEQVRHFVTAYLARGLERTLYQVYKHIATYYGAPVKGPFSETEEKIMEICVYHNPWNTVPYLSAVLSREPRGIYKRLHHMTNGKPEKQIRKKWNLAMASKFVNSLIQHTGLSLEELKYKRIDRTVWLKIQADMDHQYLYLQSYWFTYLHTQIFVKYEVKLRRLRKKILKKLSSLPYQVWKDIRWKEVRKEFPVGFTHLFLYRTTYTLVRGCPQFLVGPLSDIIDYGLEKLKKIRNKRLKTLVLNSDGNLEIVNYDVKIEFE